MLKCGKCKPGAFCQKKIIIMFNHINIPNINPPPIVRESMPTDAVHINALVNDSYFDNDKGIDKGFYRVPREQGGERTNLNEVLEIIASPTQKIYTCLHGDKIIATICIKIDDEKRSAMLSMFAIHKDYRALGLGKGLISYVEQQVKYTYNLTFLDLAVVTTQTSLIRYYHGIGFFNNGPSKLNSPRVQPKYLQNGGIDMLLMRKRLQEEANSNADNRPTVACIWG